MLIILHLVCLEKNLPFKKWLQDYDESLCNKVKSEQENNININEKVEIFGYDSELQILCNGMKYLILRCEFRKIYIIQKQTMEKFEPKHKGATLLLIHPMGEKVKE